MTGNRVGLDIKGNSSHNACGNQEDDSGQNVVANPSRGNPTNKNEQPDMITDYQYKDYRLVASITRTSLKILFTMRVNQIPWSIFKN